MTSELLASGKRPGAVQTFLKGAITIDYIAPTQQKSWSSALLWLNMELERIYLTDNGWDLGLLLPH